MLPESAESDFVKICDINLELKQHTDDTDEAQDLHTFFDKSVYISYISVICVLPCCPIVLEFKNL